MSACYRCAEPNPIFSTFISGCVCCSSCLSQVPDARQEIKSLKQRAEALRRRLQQAPFYELVGCDHLTHQAYDEAYGEMLLARRDEIEREQGKIFSDTVFTNYLRFYHGEVFDLATFEKRALKAVLQKQRQAEEANGKSLQELTLRYEEYPHYEDDAWLANYAEQNGRDVLKRREEIIKEHTCLFQRDDGFLSYVKDRAPHIYRRALWMLKVLAIAERGRYRETHEEYQQRHVRLAWRRFGDDFAEEMEAIKQRLVKEISMSEFQKKLENELPEHCREVVRKVFEQYREGRKSNEQSELPPEIYG